MKNSAIHVAGSTDSLWTASVSGSTESDIHREFIPFTNYYASEERYNSIERSFDSAVKTGDKFAFERMQRERNDQGKDKPQDWSHVSELKGWSDTVAVQYAVDAIPFSVLPDPEGKIIAQDLKGEALAIRLNEIYK